MWVGVCKSQDISVRREWQPNPVFLPGEVHGQKNLVGYNPRGCKESDMTEHTHTEMEVLDQKECLLPIITFPTPLRIPDSISPEASWMV